MDKIASICRAEFFGLDEYKIVIFDDILKPEKDNCIVIHQSSVEFSQKRNTPGEMIDVEVKIKVTDITSQVESVVGVNGILVLTYTNGTIKMVGSSFSPIVLNEETSGTPEVRYLTYKGTQPKYANVYHS